MKRAFALAALLLLLAGGLFPACEEKIPANAALLSWQAGTETDLAGYRVYVGTASRSYDPPIDVGLTDDPSAPSYLVTDLIKGTQYYFAVTAYDTSGNESDHSNEASKTIP